MPDYAPVVMFVYNRPGHAARTLAALAANTLASDTRLIIYSDGPRSETDVKTVNETRSLLRTVKGFASVTIHERELNAGLADSIAEGVTAIMEEYGRAVVLEDDIVTSPHFLEYMNTALTRYENEDQVMHIAAYMPPLAATGLPDSFFLRQSSCWGWASWRRAWRHFHRRGREFTQVFSIDDIRRFNLDGAYDYWSQLLANEDGRLKTWAVFWYACVFSRNGLCLHPRRSLTQNIGFDGSGENCGLSDAADAPVAMVESPHDYPKTFVEHRTAMRRYQAHLRGTKTSDGLCARIRNMWESLFHA